jgi:HNH endonuclease
MLPFDSYPHGGRHLLGVRRYVNTRREDGRKLMELTGLRRCAYCTADFSTYEVWSMLELDHAVPVKTCKSAHIPETWCDDYSNLVLAYKTCNGFGNRYTPTFQVVTPDTLESFYDLRDKVFIERKMLIAAKHEEERLFFSKMLSELSLPRNN